MTHHASMQAPAPGATCPHGLRPGTSVCLHCRQDARAAARQRRYRLLARVGLIGLGVGVVVALIIGGIRAIADGPSASTTQVSVLEEPVTSSGAPVAPAPPAATALVPIVPEGRRELGDSMYAVREGAQVTVYFDTETLRTRLDWKFEGVVRATLPLVFGPATRQAFDSIPAGTWVRGGDLLTELPNRGVALPVGDDTVRVWPVTRPGRDGPLVVAYRASSGR